ncbi:hypothetical protein BDAP_001543 [Binucleata daphniae]
MFLQCTPSGSKTWITNKTSSSDDGPECKKAKFEDDPNMMQYNHLDTYEYYIESDVPNNNRKHKSIVQKIIQEIPLKTQNDQACLQFSNLKEREIFKNHVHQQINDKIQDKKQKIETCKKIKKNAMNFIDLTDEIKKSFYNAYVTTQNKSIKKSTKIKKHVKDKKLYTLKNFMEDDVIKTFNLAQYMPECITKYAGNNEIFDKET